jgi:hypothetical protein
MPRIDPARESGRSVVRKTRIEMAERRSSFGKLHIQQEYLEWRRAADDAFGLLSASLAGG